MNIVVCIKQVPDTTDVKIDKKNNTLIRSGVKSIINPYDVHAIETGLQIRDELGGKVTVISMGPPQVKESLKEAVSLGVDEVVLISDRAFAGADTLATSYTLAKTIEKIGEVDLILCGKQAIDGDTAQVGPGIAEHLAIPHCTYIKNITEITEKSITVQRKIEGGFEIVKLQLPALLTVNKEINEPRLPSIRGILKAKEIDVPVWTANDLVLDKAAIGLDGSPTQVVSIATPEINIKGDIFKGTPEEQVNNLVKIFCEQQILG